MRRGSFVDAVSFAREYAEPVIRLLMTVAIH